MKRSIALFLSLLLVNFAYAQEIGASEDAPRRFYLGVGTGLNNPVGFLGLNAEFNPIDNFTIMAGGGFSTWGYKGAIGARYYLNYPRGLAFGLTYVHNTGVADPISVNLEVEDPDGTIGMRDVNVEIRPVNALNASVLYFVKMGRHHRFNLEAGYSFVLNKEDRYVAQIDGQLTPPSRFALDLLRPGGIILAVGFTFGLF